MFLELVSSRDDKSLRGLTKFAFRTHPLGMFRSPFPIPRVVLKTGAPEADDGQIADHLIGAQ
jgi:hypothetical protein